MQVCLRVLVLLILLQTSWYRSQAQTQSGSVPPLLVADSLKILLDIYTEDSLRAQVYWQLATHYQKKAPDSLLYFAQAAQVLFFKMQRPREAAKAYTLMATGYYQLKKPESALQCYQKAALLYEQIDDPISLANVHYQMGTRYMNQGEYPLALNYLFKALNIYEGLPQHLRSLAFSLDNIANVYAMQGEVAKALPYHLRAFNIIEKAKEPVAYMIITYNLALDYMDLGQNKEAIVYLHKCLALDSPQDEQHGMGSIYTSLSTAYCAEGDTLQGAVYLEKALKIKEKSGSSKDVHQYITLADYYVRAGKFAQALPYAEQGYRKALALHTPFLRMPLLEQMSTIHEALGHQEEALLYFKRYKMLSDSLFSIEKNKELNKLSLERKELENKRLESINDLQSLQIYHLDLLKTKQAQDIHIAQKQAEAEHLFALALHEQDQRKADSLFNQAEKVRLEANILKISNERAQAENKVQSVLVQKTQKESALRQRVIYLTSSSLLLVLLSLWVLYRSFSKEKKTKKALASKNAEIEMLNDTLKILLQERTDTLTLRNQQLEEYAFYNAHILRRPVANILGLYNLLLQEEEASKKVEIFPHLHSAVMELDDVVFKIQRIVER